MLHGRLLAALAARELEQHCDHRRLRPVRLTTDLFRVAPMAPVTVESHRVRDGRRVRTVEIDLWCQGQLVARTTGLLAATGPPPPGRPWSAPRWEVPAPKDLPPMARVAEAEAMGSPEMRFAGPGLDGPGPYRVWLGEPWPLVEGEPLSPTCRAVMAADVANPLTNWSDGGLGYINADITTTLVRPPAGAWIGLEVVEHLDDAGISVGACRLHDTAGCFGQSTVVGLAQTFPRPS